MPNKKALKIVQINTVPNGSTGTIMMSIHKQLTKDGYDSYVDWGRGRKAENDHEIYMNDKLGVYFHAIYSRLTGKTGFASKRATRKLLKKLDKIKPDVIHLHNLHGYYINIKLLFNYIKKNNIKTVWTLHDCWAFTGHCAYFESIRCQCWKGEKCKNIKAYPKSFVNTSKWNYAKKNQLIGGINELTIITPSNWLRTLVRKSFLSNRKCIVINNGIDITKFYINKELRSKFRNKYNLNNKVVILGVAYPWTEHKGLYDFYELANHIDDSKYKIVLVGIKKDQADAVPKNILHLEKTKDTTELLEIYNGSDIFYNPTRGDNYPTVNIEATSCGLPIIVNKVGGAHEISKYNDRVVAIRPDLSIDKLIELIDKITNNSKRTNKNEDISIEKMVKEYELVYIEGTRK